MDAIKELKDYDKEEYELLKGSGMMWSCFPEATGEYEKDVVIPSKQLEEKMINDAEKMHGIWYKFEKWLRRTFGKDLYGEWVRNRISVDGKSHTFRYRPFNELELNRRLCGYDVIVRVERYVKRHCPEIKVVHCDDNHYAGSIILLIPHPSHGISVMFIPQCTLVQNFFFLYSGHYNNLMTELEKMKNVYKDECDAV